MAQEGTWSFTWDKSRADGGEGFYHISNNDETTQEATLNGLAWTYEGNTSVTAYTGSAGQYFGSAKSPVTHATLSTSWLQGKILDVTVEAKKKEGADVTIGVSVDGTVYTYDNAETAQMTTEWASYTFVPNSAAEGTIVISLDQAEGTTGPVYFHGITIRYDGLGPQQPVMERVDPALAYETQLVTVEAGDDAFGPYLTNPYNVSPITYKSADPSIAVIASNGNIYTTGKVGETSVTASFAGDDKYLAGEASYTLQVVPKPVIAAPTLSVPGGSYNDVVTVTITSDDPLCKAIWYSTTARDSLELVDNPIIVAGRSATVTLDDACTLRCCAVDYNNIGCVTTAQYDILLPLKADFTAQEASHCYYQMGWDSVEEASTWHYYGVNETEYWRLSATPMLDGVQPFSAFDPASQYSLSINYAETYQRERAVSPEIEVLPNTQVEYYLCFSGVWLYYADLKLQVNDKTTGTTDVLCSAFEWAQENAYTGPNWIHFEFDLAQYAGHTCTFEYIYEGEYGEAMAIDGFRLTQQSDDAEARIVIRQGESVHFMDRSQGHPDYWAWTFVGGTPAMSTDRNPVVTYPEAGLYSVTLNVRRGQETDACSRSQWIEVLPEAPEAHIGEIAGAYRSPWALAYVPVGVPVTFADASTGCPTAWTWTFEGATPAISTEQNPTVVYAEEGRYGLTLDVENRVGQSHDFLVGAVQAGGSLDVWNITPEESQHVDEVSLGWFGSYAGSNWAGIEAFAEHFDAPLTTATIDGVTAYFAAVTAENPDAVITVGIALPDADGLPGETIATSSLTVSQLQCDPHEVVPTEFAFDAPVEVSGEFFITISGFPNEGYNDNVALLCAYRGDGGISTTCHQLVDYDEHFEPMGTYTWVNNVDEPLAMALTAHITYQKPVDSLEMVEGLRSVDERAYDMMGREIMTKGARRSPVVVVSADGAERMIEVR